MHHAWPKEDNLKNEDDLKNEDNLKNEDDLKNEDGVKNEDNFKNEDELKNEEVLTKRRLYWFYVCTQLVGTVVYYACSWIRWGLKTKQKGNDAKGGFWRFSKAPQNLRWLTHVQFNLPLHSLWMDQIQFWLSLSSAIIWTYQLYMIYMKHK